MSKGFFGVLESVGLVESDVPAAPEQPHAAAVAPPSPQFYPAGTPQPITLSTEDEARLKTLEAQVYAAPSSYVVFQRVRASLGGTPDIKNVFKVLAAANPGVTTAKIIADIDQHLGIIASTRTALENTLAEARATRIDAPAKEIADLTAANQAAVQQIADRTARIAQLQQATAAAVQSIAEGAARFKVIEDKLSAPLLQTRQLLAAP